MDYARRRTRLMEQLKADAFLVVHLEATDPDAPSMQYLTGYPGFGVLLVTAERIHAYASATNIGMASMVAPHIEWQPLAWGYQNTMVTILKDHGFRRVAVASRRLGMLTWRALEAAGVCELVVEEDPVGCVRETKDAAEIDCIRRATRLTEAALEATLTELRPGQTEAEIAWRLEREMRDRGAAGLAFPLIVSAGPHTALPHHHPGDRPIEEGDLLMFDIGAVVGGYCTDLTRTVSIGRPTDRMREIYDIVLEANRAGIATFSPDASGQAVEQAARDVIERAGYGEQYTHGLSHGVGIEVHERPASKGSHAVASYRPGMVCTAEPGIYLDGIGGVRIEDLLVITDSGCEVLTRFPKESLIEIG